MKLEAFDNIEKLTYFDEDGNEVVSINDVVHYYKFLIKEIVAHIENDGAEKAVIELKKIK